MAGGVKQITRESACAASLAGSSPRADMPRNMSLSLIFAASWSRPGRSSQCLSLANIMPERSPAPLIMPKPATAIVWSISGIASALSRKARTASIVRSSEAPSGRPMSHITTPLSSSGRNEPGTTLEMLQMPATKSASTATAKTERRTRKPTKTLENLREPSTSALNGAKTLSGFSRGGRSTRAQSAGERVMATNVERQSETHIVTANCT